MHIETLEHVHKESKKLPPIHKVRASKFVSKAFHCVDNFSRECWCRRFYPANKCFKDIYEFI